MDKNDHDEWRRSLGSNDQVSDYFVDENGNPIEPYSLAWRYLGMYLDCDMQQQDDENNDDDDDDDDDDEKEEEENDSGDDDEENNCQRILLWAAYQNPNYKGNSIGEYKFFNVETLKWDKATCQQRLCTKLDCHEQNTKWTLVGVYKQVDGLNDWAQQLFKHQSYCLWTRDTYQNMQEWSEKWPNECQQVKNMIDSQGNAVFKHIKPEYGGSISMGLYIDDKCSKESVNTYFDYIHAYYAYFVSEDQAAEAVQESIDSINAWNDAMDLFKICQPCRAYSLNPTQQQQDDQDYASGGENDGQGDEEQFGYNCYDATGYTNCNQCYKFATQTDMEIASVDDLARASAQGTILRIRFDGETFGQGEFRSKHADFGKLLAENECWIVVGSLIAATSSIALILFLASWRKSYKDRRPRNKSLKEKFLDDYEEESEDSIETKNPQTDETAPNKGDGADRSRISSSSSPRATSLGRQKVNRLEYGCDVSISPPLDTNSSLTDVSAVSAESSGEAMDTKFAGRLQKPLKHFLSVWKHCIRGALSGGGSDSSDDEEEEEEEEEEESSSEEDDYAEALRGESTSYGSESTRNKTKKPKTKKS